MKLKNNISLFIGIISTLLLVSCGSQSADDLKIAESPQKITSLKIGDKIPNIVLYDFAGNPIELNKFLPHKPTVLIVYRGVWCMYCNQHISQVQEVSQELFDMGYQILGISPDKPEKIKEMSDKYELSFPLLSDTSGTAIKSLGLAYDAKQIYSDMLLVLEENAGNTHYILPVPALFIVNQEGMIQFEYINPNFKIRISPELLLTAARVALQE